MANKFRTIDLSDVFNSSLKLRTTPAKGRPVWRQPIESQAANIPRGSQTYWGIPFELGPASRRAKGVIELADGIPPVNVPLRAAATHVCIVHFCDLTDDVAQNSAGGEALAEYALRYSDGVEHAVPIRRRFEVNAFLANWGYLPFASVPAAMPIVAPDEAVTHMGWGPLQTGIGRPHVPFLMWVYALENPRPNAKIKSIALRGTTDGLVGVLGMTLYNGPGHPLRHVPRKVYRLVLPPGETALPGDVKAELDMGVVTRLYAVPGKVGAAWLKAPDSGLGEPWQPPEPANDFIVEATGAEGATLTVEVAGKKKREIPFGPAFDKGRAQSPDGALRLEICNPRTAWVHVTVVDETTGKPTPVRIHFRGPRGDYIAPYGHHAQVNDRWFEDYGGDLQLGRQSFAYITGTCQVELPVGDAFVELAKGFEYKPVREKLRIAPGQRELGLSIGRACDLRRDRWVTADTHVHFITPQTAVLEGKAEGLNLINLLASQWGRLFTSVADISGAASGVSDDETIVWVGTENRNHLLGHISMLGTKGEPVFPMCAGGPDEAWIGDPDVIALTEWARMCKQRDGVVLRPHFPTPICEEPVYFMLGELDGAELRQFANPDRGSLDEFCFREWYRYLNCGCRVAAVGGTDKMSAGMPVGGVRTYAQLAPGEDFTFASWGRAVRAGRTFTTSGPLIEMTVDGKPLGSEIGMPAGGGEVEVCATATGVWPIHALEVVVNGNVVADTRDRKGTCALSLRRRVKIGESSWIAARCGSRLMASHCWPIHLGAHTSPVYVVCGGGKMFSPSDATYMLTLLDGGMTYLDTLSVRYSDERHGQIKALYDQARQKLLRRLGK
jgi:hypothetical protein